MPVVISDPRAELAAAARCWTVFEADQHAGDHRQEGQPGGDRAEALDQLQVVGQEQEHAEHGDAGDATTRRYARRGSGRRRPAAAAAGGSTRARPATNARPAAPRRRPGSRASRGDDQPAVSACEKPKTRRTARPRPAPCRATSMRGRTAGRSLPCRPARRRRRSTANTRLTYSAQRQDRYSVSTPPRIRPDRAAAARDGRRRRRTRGRDHADRGTCVTSVDRAAGASIAPNGALQGAGGDQHAERRGGAAERRRQRRSRPARR